MVASSSSSGYTITSDKTWQEIYDAIMRDGKMIYIRTNDEDGVMANGYSTDDITPISSIGSNPNDDWYYLAYYDFGVDKNIVMNCSSPDGYPAYSSVLQPSGSGNVA